MGQEKMRWSERNQTILVCRCIFLSLSVAVGALLCVGKKLDAAVPLRLVFGIAELLALSLSIFLLCVFIQGAISQC